MGKITFQVDGEMGKTIKIMGKINEIAEQHNCTFTQGHLSENGKKFEVSGTDENLKIVEQEIKLAELPKGNFWTDLKLAQLKK